MPLHEYRCLLCHQYFEVQSTESRADAKISCPKCGSTEVDKVEDAAGIAATLFPSLGGKFT